MPKLENLFHGGIAKVSKIITFGRAGPCSQIVNHFDYSKFVLDYSIN